MKFRIYFKILCAVGMLVTAMSIESCKKFVQIGPPTTQLVTASVFTNSAAATSAQMAIYNQMFQNYESYNMAQSTGFLGDELKCFSTTPAMVQYYTNNMQALSNPGPWNHAYFYIYQANAIIEAMQGNANIPAPIVAQLTGESKFLRAFWHFYLTNLYGDVPLVLTTDYTVNSSAARTPQAAVYQQIVSDLKESYAELNANYLDATDTVITTERARATKGAAAAMLARVYLYTQKYDSAEMEANLVINNSTLYSLCTNLSSAMGGNYVFEKNSSEAIWQLATPITSSEYTYDGFLFYLKGVPQTGTSNSATISSQLLSSFEPGDLRMTHWVGVYTSSSAVNYYFPYKYQTYNAQALSSSAVTEYTMMLRLAEQYLIRSEARLLKTGPDLGGALADLNFIRQRAGLGDYSGATGQDSVLAAILHERQVELFTEWGHRWLDLKRTGNLDAVMGGATGVCQSKGVTWVSTDQLFPILQSERNSDINLSQNPGY